MTCHMFFYMCILIDIYFVTVYLERGSEQFIMKLLVQLQPNFQNVIIMYAWFSNVMALNLTMTMSLMCQLLKDTS